MGHTISFKGSNARFGGADDKAEAKVEHSMSDNGQ